MNAPRHADGTVTLWERFYSSALDPTPRTSGRFTMGPDPSGVPVGLHDKPFVAVPFDERTSEVSWASGARGLLLECESAVNSIGADGAELRSRIVDSLRRYPATLAYAEKARVEALRATQVVPHEEE